MKTVFGSVVAAAICLASTTASAGWDIKNSYKQDATQIFAVETPSGAFNGRTFKIGYYWAPPANTPANAPSALVIIAHGSGGMRYRELPPCGKDNLATYAGGQYAQLCRTDSTGKLVFRADKDQNFVPAGPATMSELRTKVNGKEEAWPWLLRQAVRGPDGVPRVALHILAVDSFYTAPTAQEVFNLLRLTDKQDNATLTRQTLPHYNLGAEGVKNIDDEDRPAYIAPEYRVLGDTLGLFDHARRNGIPTENVMLLTFSNGSSGVQAAVAVPEKLPREVKEYLEASIAKHWALTNPGAGPAPGSTLRERVVAAYGDIYGKIELGVFFYGGCRLDNFMQANSSLAPGVINDLGQSREGFEVYTRLIYNFGGRDPIYTNNVTGCQNRVAQAQANSTAVPAFTYSGYGMPHDRVVGFVAQNQPHGFDDEPDDPAIARQFVERVINVYLHETGLRQQAGLPAQYALPIDFWVP